MGGRVDVLEAEIGSLRDEIATLRSEMGAAQTADYSQAEFDPAADPSFERLESTVGTLVVALRGAPTAQADGSRIGMLIGNLVGAPVEGVKLRIFYGARRPAKIERTSDLLDWRKGLREINYDAPKALPPGAWSSAAVSLPGVRPAELGYVRIEIVQGGISLVMPVK